MRWVRVYDLRNETARIAQMQEVSLNRPDLGLDPSPALVGSAAWWSAIQSGQIANRVVEGTVVAVAWGSMGDWPIWKLGTSDGTITQWTREGDHTLYVEGLAARVHIVTVRWKPGVVRAPGAGLDHEMLIRVDLEESNDRSARIGPGPFPGAYNSPPL